MRSARGAALAALLLAGGAEAADLTVTAELDRATAQIGDQVVLTVRIEGSTRATPEPELPELGDAFDVFSGGTSRNFSIVNGSVSSSYAVRFVLVPRKEGTFTLDPVTVEHEGKSFATEPLALAVTKGPPPPTVTPSDPGEQGATTGGHDVFVRATVDKSTVTLYEQVTYKVRLYAALPLLDNPSFTAPTTEGFLREDLPRRDPYLEVIDGRRYRVLEVGIALFPTAPGSLLIGEATLDCQVQEGRRRRDPGSFFSGSLFDGRRVVLRSEPLSIEVRSLPPGAPPEFDGAVGEISLRAEVDRTTVSQNDPVTLTLVLDGRGHPRTFGEPRLPPLDAFRVYPSRTEESPNFKQGIYGGRVLREMVLVPLRAGDLTIDPVRLATYSPARGRYVNLATSPIALRVLPATGGEIADDGGTRSGIEVLGTDIRFIDTNAPGFLTAAGAWDRMRSWLLLLPVPLVLFTGAWLWAARQERIGGDRTLQRRMRAARNARSRLREAEAAPPAERAGLVGNAVRGYIADRFDLPAAGLTPEAVRQTVSELEVDTAALVDFLERTDAARFAPGAGGVEKDGIEEARNWIRELERRG